MTALTTPLLAAVVLLGSSCAEPQYVSGHLHCATSGRACPDNFHCTAGLCWANGTDPDLAVTTPDDLAGSDLAGADLAASPDLSVPLDLAGADLATAPSLCSGVSALICDGFEAGTLNMTTWTKDTSLGTVTVENTRAYRGTYSLHVHTDQFSTPMSNPHATVLSYQGFNGLPPGTLYARAFVYLQSPAPDTLDQILNFSEPGGSGAGGSTTAMQYMVINDYGHGGWGESTTLQLPTDTWVCLRFDLPSGMAGTAHIWVGDMEATDARLAIPSPQPLMDHIYCGLDWSKTNIASQVAGDMWLDEIIVDNKPISCTE